VAVPVELPKQFTSAWLVVTVSAAAGSVIKAVAVVVQPLLSVTVTVYRPAGRAVAVMAVCIGELFHEYVYGAVPPAGIAVAVPVELPKQFTLVWLVVAVSAAAGWVTVAFAVVVHPLLSVTVTV
jgi:hypothetical protein